VARVHRGVELDEAVQGLCIGDRYRAVQPGDDPGAQRVDQIEWMTSRVHVVADLHAATEHRWHDDAWWVGGREHGDVIFWMLGRDGRRRFGAVGECHLDRLGARNNVPGGEDL